MSLLIGQELKAYLLSFIPAISLDGVTRNRGFGAMISSFPLRYMAATCF